MKSWYWFPTARPAFRVIETTASILPFKVQRRYRWLNMEWWITVDDSVFEDYAIAEMRRREKLLDIGGSRVVSR